MTPNPALAGIERATRGRPAPLAVVDLDAFDANLASLTARGRGLPLRLASKSVRVRALIDRALAGAGAATDGPGFTGVMAFSLREALWLARERPGLDVLVGYPTVDPGALSDLAADADLRRRVTIMADDAAQVRAAAAATEGSPGAAVRVCLDLDASLRIGPRGAVHLGVRRSPLREPAQAATLARLATEAGLHVVGVMFYEAQVAGLPDRGPAVRLVKALSLRELRDRRGRVVAAVEAELGRPLEIVNGGGSGSLEATADDPAVTELTAGSGLYCPTLFDGYRAFSPHPSAFFGLDVVRHPAPRVVTAFGGGYIASGPVGPARAPSPVAPVGARLLRAEGAGEVQTPLRIPRGAAGLPAIGDRVWLRHAKAGELMERFGEVHLVRGDTIVATVPTYRGEGRTFG